MEQPIYFQTLSFGLALVACIIVHRLHRLGFYVVSTGLAWNTIWLSIYVDDVAFFRILLYWILPLQFFNTLCLVFLFKEKTNQKVNPVYRVRFPTKGKKLVLENIRRGISIIGAAGSGKTESAVYPLLDHFAKYQFCGVIHDYKNFEITNMAKPLFEKSSVDFYAISFGPVSHRVNPIAPRYLPDEETVFEISRVLIENLLEFREDNSNTSRFFKDAVEGLVGGLIWRLKTDFPQYCTIPHLVALYQSMSTSKLIQFLKKDITAKAMADAFISGIGSDKQTAGVRSTLSNAFKKIATKKIFYVLSADEVPLDVNNPKNPAVISVVNQPKKDASLSPVIATIIHTISKQMSEHERLPSFLLLEEASTIRLLNMHRIPATLRSYEIVTVYVLQDKIQNDMLYGDKASKAILANLSYQFFGKANDPDTAKYYERYFEIIKKHTRSVNKGHNLNFDTRITQGEKEVAKRRADIFYRLKQGEFVVFGDGKDRKVQFIKLNKIIPLSLKKNIIDLDQNYYKIHQEIKLILQY